METQPTNKFVIYLLVFFFAVFVGTSLFLVRQPKSSTGPVLDKSSTSATLKQENIVIPTSAPTIGAFSLTGEESYLLGEGVVVNLLANSNGENIVGYDVILYYDPTAFEFVGAESRLGDFTIYPKDNGNYLFLTAVKSVGSQSTTVLGADSSETTIADLTFKPKKVGNYNFSLRQSAGNEKTNLVTDETEVLNPALADLSVEITE